jgi:hypothetical protein
MTESMSYLHEFENQRTELDNTIGIEIELPVTADIARQKRTATTARSMKNRHRSNKQHYHPQQQIEIGRYSRINGMFLSLSIV